MVSSNCFATIKDGKLVFVEGEDRTVFPRLIRELRKLGMEVSDIKVVPCG